MLSCVNINILILLNCFALAYSKKYDHDHCKLITELIEEHNSSLKDVLRFTCVVTSDRPPTFSNNTDDQNYFVVFVDSTSKTSGKCAITCYKVVDEKITDDLNCLQLAIKQPANKQKRIINCQEKMRRGIGKNVESAFKLRGFQYNKPLFLVKGKDEENKKGEYWKTAPNFESTQRTKRDLIKFYHQYKHSIINEKLNKPRKTFVKPKLYISGFG